MNRKISIAKAVAKHVPPNIAVLGLGTGTTVEAIIDVISEAPPNVEYVFSSARTRDYCYAKGITGVHVLDAHTIDLYIDGTDEIDHHFLALKGAGGAMTGELLCARMAKVFWVAAEAYKWVDNLGKKMPLPVEVISCARTHLARYIIGLGGRPVLRETKSEHGNDIIDCYDLSFAQPYELSQRIATFPGVISHGLFIANKPQKVILGAEDGSTKVIDYKENRN